MAKQRGIHQIKGKVGDMSYYQTAGVPGGLIRRIPEGLSARVKTAEEYANTRLNNDEFKNASMISTFAFNAVPARKASMMRRFAIAYMNKRVLDYIRQGSGDWGQRIPSEKFDVILNDILDNYAKLGPYSDEYGFLTVEAGESTIDINVVAPASLKSTLESIGCDEIDFVGVGVFAAESVVSGQFNFITGVSDPSVVGLAPDGTEATETVVQIPTTSPNVFYKINATTFTAALLYPNHAQMAIVSFIPVRTVNNVRYRMYQYATFAVFGNLPTL